MKTKTILTLLLLAAFFSMGAQDIADDNINRSPVFESVSFSAVQGSILIDCQDVDKLTSFELTGKDDHLLFEWDEMHHADRFPMKLNTKPGKVTVKYKMVGEKAKPFR